MKANASGRYVIGTPLALSANTFYYCVVLRIPEKNYVFSLHYYYKDLHSALDIVGSLGNRLSVIRGVVCPCRPRGSAVRNQVPPLAYRQEEGGSRKLFFLAVYFLRIGCTGGLTISCLLVANSK